MIRTLGLGLWVSVAALGTSYGVATWRDAGGGGGGDAPATYFAGLDWKKTEGITIPILAEDRIAGYVLARFVYTIDGETANKLATPPDPFILNDIYATLYETSGFDFNHPERYDLEALKTRIKDGVNKRYGEEIIHELLVDQFDFLPKNEMAPPQEAAVH